MNPIVLGPPTPTQPAPGHRPNRRRRFRVFAMLLMTCAGVLTAVLVVQAGKDATMASSSTVRPPDSWRPIEDAALANSGGRGWTDPETGVTLTTATAPAARAPLGRLVRAAAPRIARKTGAGAKVRLSVGPVKTDSGSAWVIRAAVPGGLTVMQVWLRAGTTDTIVTAAGTSALEVTTALAHSTGIDVLAGDTSQG